MKNMHSFVLLFNGMSSINRFSQYRLINPESVLEHTGMVAITTMYILDQLNHNAETAFDGRYLRTALCHDMDEILTGDIPMPTKYNSKESKEMLDKIASDNMKQIDLMSGTAFYRYWECENKVVKMADVMAVFYKVYQEHVLYGNMYIVKAIEHLDGALEKARQDLRDHYKVPLTLDCLIEEMIIWVRTNK